MIVKAEEQHLNIVRKITQHTIDEIYQHYYPIGAVEFFSKNYCEVMLDASMPAKRIYKMRGYAEIEYNQIETENGDVLCYDVMKKEC